MPRSLRASRPAERRPAPPWAAAPAESNPIRRRTFTLTSYISVSRCIVLITNSGFEMCRALISGFGLTSFVHGHTTARTGTYRHVDLRRLVCGRGRALPRARPPSPERGRRRALAGESVAQPSVGLSETAACKSSGSSNCAMCTCTQSGTHCCCLIQTDKQTHTYTHNARVPILTPRSLPAHGEAQPLKVWVFSSQGPLLASRKGQCKRSFRERDEHKLQLSTHRHHSRPDAEALGAANPRAPEP